MGLQSGIAWENLLYTLILIVFLAGLSYWYRHWKRYQYWKRPRKNRPVSRAKKISIALRNKAARQGNRIKNRVLTRE